MTDTNYYDLILQQDINWGVLPRARRAPGGGLLSGTQVGIHSLAEGQEAVEVEWDISVNSLSSINSDEIAGISYPGAAVGDFAIVAVNSRREGLIFSAEVNDVNTVMVTVFNPTAATVSLGTVTLRILVFKSK